MRISSTRFTAGLGAHQFDWRLCLAAKQARSERKLQGATASFGILNVLYILNSVVTPISERSGGTNSKKKNS
jgi:hypothetical protein